MTFTSDKPFIDRAAFKNGAGMIGIGGFEKVQGL
jgi:hypothetical protein